MGCVLERRSVTPDEAALGCRANVCTTYIQLAKAVPGADIQPFPEFTIARGPIDLPFVNFILGLQLDAQGEETRAIAQLVELCQHNDAMRVFHMTGDKPDHVGKLLAAAGFRTQATLIEMAFLDATSPSTIELCESEGAEGRLEVARFMVHQFFLRLRPGVRARIAAATAGTDHRLFAVRRRGQIVGAVMVTESPTCLGLYNLCVSPAFRGRGLGKEIAQAVCALANTQQKYVILQCAPLLRSWYEQVQFRAVGTVDSLALGSAQNLHT